MEQADGGTLFLDEVGEMPSEVQAMLLRSLESNEIHPLGTETARSIDLRLISATDTNLEEAIDGNKFNEPLYHRLAEFALSIPPLRDRRDDIGRLLVHLIRLAGQEMKVGDPLSSGSEERPWLSSSVVEELLNHHWPGNVRQLRNVARQLVVCHHDEERARISEVVQSALQGGRDITGNIQSSPQADEQPLVAKNLEAISEDDLVDALRQAQWRRDAAAKLLGISRTSIYQLIRKSKRLRTIQEIPSDELKQAFEAQRGDLLKMANALEISPHALKIRLKDEGLL
jgi:two-component system nitrogen regulation response regulator GlnG